MYFTEEFLSLVRFTHIAESYIGGLYTAKLAKLEKLKLFSDFGNDYFCLASGRIQQGINSTVVFQCFWLIALLFCTPC
jgi:hypothetical protein